MKSSSNSGPSQRPSLSSIGKLSSWNSGPSRRPSLSSQAIHGRHRTHHFKLSKFKRHPFRPGRQSGLGRVYHPPKQYLNPVTVVIEFRLSIIHRPGLRFAHCSLDPPSESEVAPSTDLVYEIILRFRLSLGASQVVMMLDVSGCRHSKLIC